MGNRNGILTTCKKPSLQSKALKSITECKLQPKACSSFLLPHCLMNTEHCLPIEALYKVLWLHLFIMFENLKVCKALGFPDNIVIACSHIKHIINCTSTHTVVQLHTYIPPPKILLAHTHSSKLTYSRPQIKLLPITMWL